MTIRIYRLRFLRQHGHTNPYEGLENERSVMKEDSGVMKYVTNFFYLIEYLAKLREHSDLGLVFWSAS
jgi:hypothetical protein